MYEAAATTFIHLRFRVLLVPDGRNRSCGVVVVITSSLGRTKMVTASGMDFFFSCCDERLATGIIRVLYDYAPSLRLLNCSISFERILSELIDFRNQSGQTFGDNLIKFFFARVNVLKFLSNNFFLGMWKVIIFFLL